MSWASHASTASRWRPLSRRPTRAHRCPRSRSAAQAMGALEPLLHRRDHLREPTPPAQPAARRRAPFLAMARSCSAQQVSHARAPARERVELLPGRLGLLPQALRSGWLFGGIADVLDLADSPAGRGRTRTDRPRRTVAAASPAAASNRTSVSANSSTRLTRTACERAARRNGECDRQAEDRALPQPARRDAGKGERHGHERGCDGRSPGGATQESVVKRTGT